MSESPLMLSVSGARGIIGRTMTPAVAAGFARAFASVVMQRGADADPVIVLGRDSRPSGAEMARATAQALVEAGCRVIDLGIVMTPTVGVMVQEKRAVGGMVITASHNPSQWNGVKCLNHHGAAPPNAVAQAIIAAFGLSGGTDSQSVQRSHFEATDHFITSDPSASAVHINRVLRAVGEQAAAAIRACQFRIVLDSINGAGSAAGRALLETLGCDVVHLNGEPNGCFAHPPEPVEENLRGVGEAVTRERAQIGFAQDPDGDRLAIVDEHGRYIGEEYTLALCALRALERLAASPQASASSRETILAANLSTSRMIDDIAARFPQLHPRVIRTAVGEANVVEALQAAQAQGARALIGGEGNGGVIDPNICWVRDSLISMALVLDLLASSSPSPAGRGAGGEGVQSLSNIIASLPRYSMIKRKIDLSALGGREAVAPMLAKVKAEFSNRATHPDARVSDIDGIRIDFKDGWVHLRPSNTEPIVRLIAEGTTQNGASELIERAAGSVELR